MLFLTKGTCSNCIIKHLEKTVASTFSCETYIWCLVGSFSKPSANPLQLVDHFADETRSALVSASRNALPSDFLLVLLVIRKFLVKLIERFELGGLLQEHVSLEPPRENLGDLVVHMSSSGYSEDVIELF
jgi:hypothetical protein